MKTLLQELSSSAPAATSSSCTLSALKLLKRCKSSTLIGLPLFVYDRRGLSGLDIFPLTLLKLSVLVKAIGSESLLRREAGAFTEDGGDVPCKACVASGDDRETDRDVFVLRC